MEMPKSEWPMRVVEEAGGFFTPRIILRKIFETTELSPETV